LRWNSLVSWFGHLNQEKRRSRETAVPHSSSECNPSLAAGAAWFRCDSKKKRHQLQASGDPVLIAIFSSSGWCVTADAASGSYFQRSELLFRPIFTLVGRIPSLSPSSTL